MLKKTRMSIMFKMLKITILMGVNMLKTIIVTKILKEFWIGHLM